MVEGGRSFQFAARHGSASEFWDAAGLVAFGARHTSNCGLSRDRPIVKWLPLGAVPFGPDSKVSAA